jgi:hypothetical protein
MRKLWREAANLFLKYPILWLPAVCAGLLNVSLELLRRAATTQVFYWLSTRPSLLGGAPVHVYGEVAYTRTFWISGLMEWSLRYLTICLDTVALVLTATLVTMIVRGEQPRFRVALAELWNYPRRILGYSFTLYGLVVIFDVFVSLPALRLLHWVTNLTATTEWIRAVNFTLTRGQSLVSLILFAWIITPVTIRLLRAPGAEPPSSDEKKLGRYLVILTGAGALALYALSPAVQASCSSAISRTGLCIAFLARLVIPLYCAESHFRGAGCGWRELESRRAFSTSELATAGPRVHAVALRQS